MSPTAEAEAIGAAVTEAIAELPDTLEGHTKRAELEAWGREATRSVLGVAEALANFDIDEALEGLPF